MKKFVITVVFTVFVLSNFYIVLRMYKNKSSMKRRRLDMTAVNIDSALSTAVTRIDHMNVFVDYNDKPVNKNGVLTIHIGTIMTKDDGSLSLLLLLKSVLAHSPGDIVQRMHFHFLVDSVARTILESLIGTWEEILSTAIKMSIYDITNDTKKNETIFLPPFVEEFILLKINALVINDIIVLWKYLKHYTTNCQVAADGRRDCLNNDPRHVQHTIQHFYTANFILLIKHQKKYSDLQIVRSKDCQSSSSTQLDLPLWIPCEVTECKNKVIAQNLDTQQQYSVAFKATQATLHLNGYRQLNHSQKKMTVASGHYCGDMAKISKYSFRTLLYLYGKPYYSNKAHDVTLVTQVSMDRVSRLPQLLRHWKGPVSIAIYMEDSELEKLIKLLDDSNIVSSRTKLNVAIHAVFKFSQVYPINYIRNVALNASTTPYVFLNDFDLFPNYGSYALAMSAIAKQQVKPDKKIAFVVPAFETAGKGCTFPESKDKLIEYIKQSKARQFHVLTWAKAHSPTYYNKWMSVTKPYSVKYQNQYEPYVIVKSNVVRYDTRFVGYGWNKVSHLMELNAQGYQFIVLPKLFVLHMWHPTSLQRRKFFSNTTFRKCLRRQEIEFKNHLEKKYTDKNQ